MCVRLAIAATAGKSRTYSPAWGSFLFGKIQTLKNVNSLKKHLANIRTCDII